MGISDYQIQLENAIRKVELARIDANLAANVEFLARVIHDSLDGALGSKRGEISGAFTDIDMLVEAGFVDHVLRLPDVYRVNDEGRAFCESYYSSRR